MGLVTSLAVAKGKCFLIEEVENDLHPKALKSLLDLIAEKSRDNQIIISTHSNVVMRKLGALPDSKVFWLKGGLRDNVPTTELVEVSQKPEDRQSILEDLGYSLDDDLWSGWLFFEESSAEKIVREYLIPWFAPRLQQKVRTFSSHSASEVESRFEDFNDVFKFVHLEPIYKNKAWVLIDAGASESEIVRRLRLTYEPSGWNAENFLQLAKHDFEEYYPDDFRSEFQGFKNLGKQERRARKRELLSKVESWIRTDPSRAKAAFAVTAAEIVLILQNIERALQNSI